jgi:hypothetical protein
MIFFKNKNANINIIIKIFIFLIIINLVVTLIEIDIPINKKDIFSLSKNGIEIFYNTNYLSNESLPNLLKTDILNILPKNYIFMDYTYTIKNSALSTFHRDVTSSQKLYNTTYPVYTAILYKTGGVLLSVVPYSDIQYPFSINVIHNISGKAGTAVLFNSDTLHCGISNGCNYREVVQYKICHKDDLLLLSHLQGIHKIKDNKKDCVEINNKYEKIKLWVERKSSYLFQLPINLLFYPFMTKKYDTNTFYGKIQEYIPLTFYNNT